jgi:N-acetylglucosamine-6-sulfatase
MMGESPNVVLIVTDDQPKGLLSAMPITRAEIRDKGVNLARGVASTALCGPSRASTLTGMYPHQLGLWINTEGGGWPVFSQFENETLATALHYVGYYTGLFGKYMNGWNQFSSVVPPGWDEFRAIKPDDGGDGAYYDYILHGTGSPTHYGSNESDYSTDVLSSAAESFIRNAPANQPVFLYFATYGAHGPMEPAQRHKGTWPTEVTLNPSVNHSNVGKSEWLQDLPEVNEKALKNLIKAQGECCMSIDEGVGGLISALEGTGRIENTLFVFLGDNGYQLGSHRLKGKNVPYKASSNIQMLLRWDGHYPAGETNFRVTPTVDLTETILDAAMANLPNSSGINFTQNRKGTPLSGGVDSDHPAYIGWRTSRYMFCQYSTGEEEFYDYENDPYELHNIITAGTHQSKIDAFRDRAEHVVDPRPTGW